MGLKVKIDNKTLKNERKSGNGFSDLLQQEISFNGGKWNTKKKEQFFTELSVLLMSGIDLRQSLELLSEENKTKKESSFFKAVYDDVVNGIPFYETLQSSKKFSDYEIETLRVGEATGNLGLVSKDLGEFCKKKNDQRRQITSALTYPVIVILTAFLVVFFIGFLMVLDQISANLRMIPTTVLEKISNSSNFVSEFIIKLPLLQVGQFALPLVGFSLMALLLQALLPSRKVPLKPLIPGSILIGIGLTTLNLAVSKSILSLGTRFQAYGFIGGFLVLTLWVWLLGVILYFGQCWSVVIASMSLTSRRRKN